MATTESLLSALTSRWTGPGAITNMNATLQYVITEPRLEDGAEGVKVTFTGDEVTAVVGAHESPDLVVSLNGAAFAQLANDNLWLTKGTDWKKLSIKSKSRRGLVLGKALFASFIQRP